MADMLRAAGRAAPDFLVAIDVMLIETSPTLRAVQAKTLEGCGARMGWQSSFDAALADRPVFVLANEFFDALPIRQYVKTEAGWNERMVTLDERGALALRWRRWRRNIWPCPRRAVRPRPGAVYEVAPSALAFAEEIGAAIAAHGGAALIIDYGYGGGAGFGDTLQAVKAHKFAPVLDTPGEADLSAHVDFAALAAAAARGGAKPYGPVAQGALLARLGLEARAAQLARAQPATAAEQEAAVARLMGAREMGTLFQALAILPERAGPPPGF